MEYKIGFLVSATKSNNGCGLSVTPPLEYYPQPGRKTRLSILDGVGYFVITSVYKGRPTGWLDVVTGQSSETSLSRIDMKVIADIGPKISEWPEKLRALKNNWVPEVTEDNLYLTKAVVGGSSNQGRRSAILAKQGKNKRVGASAIGVLNMTLSPSKRRRLKKVRQKLAKSLSVHTPHIPSSLAGSQAGALGGVYIDALAFLALTVPLTAYGSEKKKNPVFGGVCQLLFDGSPSYTERQLQSRDIHKYAEKNNVITDFLVSAKTRNAWEMFGEKASSRLSHVCSFMRDVNRNPVQRIPLPKILLALPSIETVSARTAINTRMREYITRRKLYFPFVKEVDQLEHADQDYKWHTYPYKTHVMLVPTPLIVAMAHYYTNDFGLLDSDLIHTVLREEIGAEGLFLRKGQVAAHKMVNLQGLFAKITQSTSELWTEKPKVLVPFLGNRHRADPLERYNPADITQIPAAEKTKGSLMVLVRQLKDLGPDGITRFVEVLPKVRKELNSAENEELDKALAAIQVELEPYEYKVAGEWKVTWDEA